MAVDLSSLGIGSGLDNQGIISALVSVEQQPIDALQSHQQQINSASQTISTLSSKLSALKSAAVALSTTTGFSSYSASSTDAAVVTSVTGAASSGAYSVAVSALAREQRTYSNAQSTSGALGMSGTLSIQVGSGTAVSVSIASGDALTDIANKISSSGARVSAAVVYDGTNYELQVRGLDTGAANNITFGESGFSLGLTNPANTFQTAQDASLTVDGIAITRSTNQVTGVIPGVTLALTAKTTTPATVTVGQDNNALETKIKTFVSAYNDVVNTSHSAAGFGSAKASNPLLAGDPVIRSTLDRLNGMMAEVVPGATGAYTTLSSVGLKTGSDGTLSFDTSAFEKAMTTDPASVSRLFVTDSTTGATGVMSALGSAVDSMTTGTSSPFVSRITSYGSQSKSIADQIVKMQARVTQYQNTLQAQFTALDTVVNQYRTSAASLSSLNTSSSNSKGWL